MPRGIFFQDLTTRSRDLLQELSDPDLVRAHPVPRDVAVWLRREQVGKLRGNIDCLRRKQEEFNRKMDEYVRHLERLIESLERSAASGSPSLGSVEKPAAGTHVSCTLCREERTFQGLRVIFARESDESISRPTECYVTECGVLKKGLFFCGRCGGDSLRIQAR